MSDELRTLYWLTALLVITTAMLVYLDWRKQGEIDHLHERVDALMQHTGREYIARILRAHDDATAEAAAQKGD
jgi:hypothetical protein